MSRLKNAFMKGVLGLICMGSALFASAAIMEFDIPDPALPFWCNYPTATQTGTFGLWTPVPVTITRSANDPGLTVIPGDPADPVGRVFATGDATLGENYEIYPGEPVDVPVDAVAAVKGRFYFRARRAAVELPNNQIQLTTLSSGPRGSIKITMNENNDAIFIDAVALTGSTDPVTLWICFLNIDIPAFPPEVAPVVATLANLDPHLGDVPQRIDGFSLPYGPATGFVHAPPRVLDDVVREQMTGNTYFPIKVTPKATAPNNSVMRVQLNSLTVGTEPYTFGADFIGQVRFVDRIMAFSTNSLTVKEGSTATLKFNISKGKGFPIDTWITFFQQTGTERDAVPTEVNGEVSKHPDFYGDNTGTDIIVYNNDPDGDTMVFLPAGQTSGELIVSTVNNGWFDPYTILRVIPDPDVLPTYKINPYCDVYIEEAGTWPSVAFAVSEIVLPPDSITVDIPVIVDRTSVGDYLPSVTIKGQGGLNEWTKANTVNFNLNERIANVLAAVPNYSGKDVKIVYHLTAPVNCKIGPRRTCSVTVLGQPSLLRLVSEPGPITPEGQDVMVKISMDKARSYDVTLPLNVVPPPQTEVAVQGRDFFIPPQVTFKAGAKTATFKIQVPKTYDKTTDAYRYANIVFGSPVSKNIGSWVGNTPPTIRLAIQQKPVDPPTGIWVTSTHIEANIEKPFDFFAGYAGGPANEVILYAVPPQKHPDAKILFGTVQSDGSVRWVPAPVTIPLALEGPSKVLIKVSNGIDNLGNFSYPLRVKVGAQEKTVHIKVVDRRPTLYPSSAAAIAFPSPINPSYAVTSDFTFNPLESARNAYQLATKDQVDNVYLGNDFNLATYTGFVTGDKAPQGGFNPAYINLMATGQALQLGPMMPGAPLTTIQAPAAVITDTNTYASMDFAYSAMSMTKMDYEYSADSITMIVGGEGLRRSRGFVIPLGGEVLPLNSKTVWGTWVNPFDPANKPSVTRKMMFPIKKDNYGGKYALCKQAIKLYSEKELKKIQKNGLYSDYVPQYETVPVSILYKTDTSTLNSNYKYFVYRPVVDGIQSWGDNAPLPLPDVSLDTEPKAYQTVTHMGSILRVTGRYFGDKPKVWLENSRDGANAILQAQCKVLSITPVPGEELQFVMLVRFPTSLPSAWNYDDADVVNAEFSRTKMIVSSGSGLTGAHVILRPFTQVSLADNARPTAFQGADTAPIFIGSYQSDKWVDFPITLKKFQSTTFSPGYLANDVNGDDLIVSYARAVNVDHLRGSVKILTDAKTGAQTLRFTPNNQNQIPGARIRIEFQVKERWGKNTGLEAVGFFSVQYN